MNASLLIIGTLVLAAGYTFPPRPHAGDLEEMLILGWKYTASSIILVSFRPDILMKWEGSVDQIALSAASIFGISVLDFLLQPRKRSQQDPLKH